ncbi:hypothetical protein C8R45DRAFT_1067958 [Mycena sanguinolenta]|nr:hypothetical protein C8R45DRAFT_1067958 [Mycena sanguinolenta]
MPSFVSHKATNGPGTKRSPQVNPGARALKRGTVVKVSTGVFTGHYSLCLYAGGPGDAPDGTTENQPSIGESKAPTSIQLSSVWETQSRVSTTTKAPTSILLSSLREAQSRVSTTSEMLLESGKTRPGVVCSPPIWDLRSRSPWVFPMTSLGTGFSIADMEATGRIMKDFAFVVDQGQGELEAETVHMNPTWRNEKSTTQWLMAVPSPSLDETTLRRWQPQGTSAQVVVKVEDQEFIDLESMSRARCRRFVEEARGDPNLIEQALADLTGKLSTSERAYAKQRHSELVNVNQASKRRGDVGSLYNPQLQPIRETNVPTPDGTGDRSKQRSGSRRAETTLWPTPAESVRSLIAQMRMVKLAA